MYLPEHFRQDDPGKLRELMAAFPLAALISGGANGLTANHIPLLFDPDPAPHGILRGHMARGNPQWKSLGGQEAMAIFQGPQAYVSPNWYPTKREHGKVVPTWNYTAVHVWGTVEVHPEREWLAAFLDRLTAAHEAGQPIPWKPSDAPASYVEGLLGAIVGIELKILRMEGKWKMSQNQPEVNRQGALQGLEALGTENAREVARLIGESGPKPAGSKPAGLNPEKL
jgi:transcriptional regulator